jgi:type I thyroxine 5'-deiodinase
MARRWGDRAGFVTVYIKEAHPEDEWQMDANEKESVCYPQPRTLSQRLAIANDFVRRFDYRVPLFVDRMDDGANALYAGWPERFYVIDENGRIAYKGKPGPFGYRPEEVERWLTARFGNS